MFRFLLRNLEITTYRKMSKIKNKNIPRRLKAARENKNKNRVFSVGDLSQGPHLFPFRTEKLSPVELMILFMGKVSSRQHRVLDSKKRLF